MAVRSILLLSIAISLALATIPHPSLATTIEFDLAPNDLAPDSDIIYPPTPSIDPAYSACAAKITLDCAAEIIINDLFSFYVEDKCCKQLIRMGKKCNDLILDDMTAIFDDDDHKRVYEMHQRSEHLWNRCLNVLDKY